MNPRFADTGYDAKIKFNGNGFEPSEQLGPKPTNQKKARMTGGARPGGRNPTDVPKTKNSIARIAPSKIAVTNKGISTVAVSTFPWVNIVTAH